MTAADTSAVVAAFASWHEAHEPARAALTEAVLVSQCALEAYSVLTRLPVPHRAPGALVHAFLERQFSAPHLVPTPALQRGLVGRLVELGVQGGAVYDALVALTAAAAGATLVSCDRRAAATYERCGVRVQMVA